MKMKRVLACALSAAMIVTFVSFGNMGVGMVHAAVDIENESVTVEEKVLKEIESEVLKANAKANSEQKPAAWDNDGEAGWAFDDENHWWHSRYQGNPVEGEVNSGLVSASNPIWIQTGFGEAKKIKKITYLSRDNGMGSINAYKVQYANVQQGEPRDDDFHDIAGAAGNLQNARTAQEIVFNEAVTATHIRLVATSIYANGGQQYVAAKRIRVFEETEGTEGVTYNFYKESDFWDYEVAYGNLADQTENADRWHYQIKKPSEGGWIDIPANALKTKDNGEKSWMNDDKGLDGTYYYAKLNKDEITSTFQGEAYTAVAYAWKAPKNGYFKMTLESPITQASSPAPSFFVCHSSDNQDGKDLFRNIVGANSTITSKIARVHTGEWLRLGATTKNAWASGLKPVVMEVTAKDYAVQYLEEVSGIEEGNSYTEASKQAVKEARSALQEAILPEVPDMVVVEQKITALEQAIAGLQEYVPVTEVTLNVTEANLKVGETVQLTAIVAPDNASQEVLWVSDAEGIASVDSATGLVTANSAGTAIITATSTMNPEKKAQCTVVVTRDDTALDVAIKAAEEKIREENFENKYTEASKTALRENLENAKLAIEGGAAHRAGGGDGAPPLGKAPPGQVAAAAVVRRQGKAIVRRPEASKTALRENLENAKLAKENANLSVEDVKLVVDALNASIEELQLKAVVTINNNDQIETKYCEIGEQVRVVAQTVKDKKFSHWTFNGTPICYSSPYTFTVYGDTTIEAVYVDAGEEVTPQAAMLCSVSYNKSTQTIKYTAKRSVPEGCKIVKHGMILTSKPAWEALYKDNQEAFKLEADRIITKVATTTGLAGNYSVSVKCTKPNIWYAKGYVVYTDKNGEEQTVYSDVVSYEVK